MITVTLKELQRGGLRADSLFVRSGQSLADDAPIPLTAFLDVNGIIDAVRALSVVADHRGICIQYAADIAAQVSDSLIPSRIIPGAPIDVVIDACDLIRPGADIHAATAIMNAAWTTVATLNAETVHRRVMATITSATLTATDANQLSAAWTAARARLRQYLEHGEGVANMGWPADASWPTMSEVE